MKKILIGLFAACYLSSGQAPPMAVKPAATTAVPLPPGVIPIPPDTTAAAAQTTAAVQTPLVTDPPAVPVVTAPKVTDPAPVVTAPKVTDPAIPATPQTTAALPPGVVPLIPAIPAIPAPAIPAPAPVPNPKPAGPFPPVNPPVIGRPVIPSPPPVAVLEPIPLAPTTPKAPEGYVYGAFDQFCPVPDPNRDYVCRSPNDMGSDLLPGQSPGFLKCERSYDCCLCSSLLCQDCNTLSIGPSGAYGVKDIVVNGREAKLGGAQIKCQSMESCLHSVMNTQTVREIECLGDMSCMGSTVRVFDPVLPGFKLDCSGTASCDGMTLEVVIPGPPPGYVCNPEAGQDTLRISGLECSGQESAATRKST